MVVDGDLDLDLDGHGICNGIGINRPPTGGDLAFSWKKGHICTVVCPPPDTYVVRTGVFQLRSASLSHKI